MAYDIKFCRYLLQGACIHEEKFHTGDRHAVGETLFMNSINYKVIAVIVDGTTQVIDLECIQREVANG